MLYKQDEISLQLCLKPLSGFWYPWPTIQVLICSQKALHLLHSAPHLSCGLRCMLLSHLLVLVLLHCSPPRTHFPSPGSALPHLLGVPLRPGILCPLVPRGCAPCSFLYTSSWHTLCPFRLQQDRVSIARITHLLSVLTSPEWYSSWVCWDKPVIPALNRLRQDDREFEVSLNDKRNLVSKQKRKCPLKSINICEARIEDMNTQGMLTIAILTKHLSWGGSFAWLPGFRSTGLAWY